MTGQPCSSLIIQISSMSRRGVAHRDAGVPIATEVGMEVGMVTSEERGDHWTEVAAAKAATLRPTETAAKKLADQGKL
jgi:NAD(P)-dependent dehydrogenase (short-subunit alcohol dehydrogenase family)